MEIFVSAVIHGTLGHRIGMRDEGRWWVRCMLGGLRRNTPLRERISEVF